MIYVNESATQNDETSIMESSTMMVQEMFETFVKVPKELRITNADLEKDSGFSKLDKIIKWVEDNFEDEKKRGKILSAKVVTMYYAIVGYQNGDIFPKIKSGNLNVKYKNCFEKLVPYLKKYVEDKAYMKLKKSIGTNVEKMKASSASGKWDSYGKEALAYYKALISDLEKAYSKM